jgi:hypothetical protein
VIGHWVDAIFWFALGGAAGWHAHKTHPERHGAKAVAGVVALWGTIAAVFVAARYLLGGNGL